jgi:hypothetical protein
VQSARFDPVADVWLARGCGLCGHLFTSVGPSNRLA